MPLLQKNNLTPLFDLCRQFVLYLDGKLAIQQPIDIHTIQSRPLGHNQQENWLIGNTEDGLTMKAIIQDLQTLYPDAGNRYYMTRTWDLVCWQPMYIAFIAIYGLKQLPDFSHFKQKHQNDAVYGFSFTSEKLTTAPIEQLISMASDQLRNLFEHYRTQLDTLTRCRPGYVKRLIADLILDNLMKVNEHIAGFTDDDLQRHAQLWFAKMALPAHLINALKIHSDKPIEHIRTSCCLTYKADNTLCVNCPKHSGIPKNE